MDLLLAPAASPRQCSPYLDLCIGPLYREKRFCSVGEKLGFHHVATEKLYVVDGYMAYGPQEETVLSAFGDGVVSKRVLLVVDREETWYPGIYCPQVREFLTLSCCLRLPPSFQILHPLTWLHSSGLVPYGGPICGCSCGWGGLSSASPVS